MLKDTQDFLLWPNSSPVSPLLRNMSTNPTAKKNSNNPVNKMFKNALRFITDLGGATEDDNNTTTKLSADSPPFVPSPSPSTNELPALNLDEGASLSAEYEAQSANLDAEVNMEMQECLDAIATEKTGNYLAAVASNLETISKSEQRCTLRARTLNSQSEEEDTTDETRKDEANDTEGKNVETKPESSSESVEANDSIDDDGVTAEYTAAKSFGHSRVQNYYRTKDRRDAKRLERADEVAARAGRQPGQRNVACRAHYASDVGRKQKRYEARGGSRMAFSSHVAGEQQEQLIMPQ